MTETVVVLGGRGMLGSDLAALLGREGYPCRAPDLPECDIANPAHLENALSGAQIVVNCAAFTNVDRAEEMPDAALAVNATAVGALGRLARRKNIYVAHISTDFVFDGAGDRPYLETDEPHPLNVYGQSKLKGEEALRQSGCAHAIMRVEWSYGRRGVNFIAKFIEHARTGGELKVVADQFGAPTWTADMARAVLGLVRGRQAGLFHFANGGYASRYEVAGFIAREIGLTNKILPCASADFPLPAVRPKNSRFDTAKITAVLDHPIRPWQDALAEFLHQA